jgi:hypothetical protein
MHTGMTKKSVNRSRVYNPGHQGRGFRIPDRQSAVQNPKALCLGLKLCFSANGYKKCLYLVFSSVFISLYHSADRLIVDLRYPIPFFHTENSIFALVLFFFSNFTERLWDALAKANLD